MESTPRSLLRREESSTDIFLGLLANPFSSQLQSDAVVASLGTSLGITAVVAALFCLLRPYNTVVYAPKSKHADDKHTPPRIGKGVFAWVGPVVKTKELMLVEKIGLDGAIFIRFTKMCRNVFLILSLIGCGILIPVNVLGSKNETDTWTDVSALMKMTPQYLSGDILWAFVLCAYSFNIVICFFLWRNYRAVTGLRRQYFESPEYQNSLSARTLMVTDIPKKHRTDQGIVQITDELKTLEDIPRAVIARNVKDLPDLIEEHEEAVKKLEKVLAKYLKNPNKLPAKRPLCKPSKKDRSKNSNEKVDAIDYLTERIRELETRIREVRETVDNRNPLPYGFASYESVADAHSVAYVGRNKHPQGTTVKLAPKPTDLIWKNLPLDKKARRWRAITNNLWVALLTAVWIVPNALIAVFLSNLHNLGQVWHDFDVELQKNPKTWAVVQGVLAPALTSLFYFFLPAIFRKLSVRAGDVSKTSRERHVTHKLYAFFVFNNLIVFSLFSTIWGIVATVIQARDQNPTVNIWETFIEEQILWKFMVALCSVSPYWITWLLQRNLGAAIDLSQVANLAWGSFARKFLSPTPRQLIELTAPPPFDYASYYNYFLFYSTVALCFGPMQPLIFPVTALYFVLDSYLKKYLLLYVFITKNESGGAFWRVLVNRVLFAALFNNLILFLLIIARAINWAMVGCLVPAPLLLLAFKIYCMRTYDDQMHFYSKGDMVKKAEGAIHFDKQSRRSGKVGVRYGHPALYKTLITPMVRAKSQHLLAEVYRGRLDSADFTTGGYSDTYSMQGMSKNRPGKPAASPAAPFEIVQDHEMDFEHFKNRAEFREEHGGDGGIYGKDRDLVSERSGTPASFMTGDRGRSSSRESDRTFAEQGVTYPAGYHKTPRIRSESPASVSSGFGPVPSRGGGASQYDVNLLSGAAPMGATAPSKSTPGAPQQYAAYTPGSDSDTSYDYFRRGQ